MIFYLPFSLIDVSVNRRADSLSQLRDSCATCVISITSRCAAKKKRFKATLIGLSFICQCLRFFRKETSALTWHVVPLNSSSMVFGHDDATPKDVRILLNVAPRTKLGCG